MKKIEKISENKNYTAVSIGSMDELTDYSFIHPKTKQEVRGKVFVKEATNATGTEISFTALPPQSELPYFHFHNKDEETFIILKENPALLGNEFGIVVNITVLIL
ncbi:MAG: hypothetical protein LBG15_15370 [Dysgonamonadaceae bacterium]|jgi:uncharacterized cupin superfamily protein|nr:hypothetical protein [Dysgonamonadaceae bacterium]